MDPKPYEAPQQKQEPPATYGESSTAPLHWGLAGIIAVLILVSAIIASIFRFN